MESKLYILILQDFLKKTLNFICGLLWEIFVIVKNVEFGLLVNISEDLIVLHHLILHRTEFKVSIVTIDIKLGKNGELFNYIINIVLLKDFYRFVDIINGFLR